MMIQGLLIVFAVTSLCSATGSTVRMMNSSLTVREGETVSVCVVATLSAGESVEVGLNQASESAHFQGNLTSVTCKCLACMSYSIT